MKSHLNVIYQRAVHIDHGHWMNWPVVMKVKKVKMQLTRVVLVYGLINHMSFAVVLPMLAMEKRLGQMIVVTVGVICFLMVPQLN